MSNNVVTLEVTKCFPKGLANFTAKWVGALGNDHCVEYKKQKISWHIKYWKRRHFEVKLRRKLTTPKRKAKKK